VTIRPAEGRQQLEAAPAGAQAVVHRDRGEAGVGQQPVQAPVEVLGQPLGAVEALQQPRRPAHERVARAPPVGDVQAPACPQHADRLGQRGALGVGAEMVQQQRHDDAVGAAARQRQRRGGPSRHCTASAPAFARASASTSGSPSTATTSAPRAASAMASVPVPQPTSITLAPGASPSST
jgi:hypothetical protein